MHSCGTSGTPIRTATCSTRKTCRCQFLVRCRWLRRRKRLRGEKSLVIDTTQAIGEHCKDAIKGAQNESKNFGCLIPFDRLPLRYFACPRLD
mgnify:CR=1 FL=1